MLVLQGKGPRTLAGLGVVALLTGCVNQTPSGETGETGEPLTVTQTVSGATQEQPTENPAPSEDPGPAPTLGEGPGESVVPTEGECGPPLSGEDAAARWVDQVPTYNDWPWAVEYADVRGYDPCLPLSYIVLPIEGATASSPYQIMLFHKGDYLGTATAEAYGFSPGMERLGDSTIQVTWRWPNPGDSNANPTGRSTAQFTWDEAAGRVIMSGEVPE